MTLSAAAADQQLHSAVSLSGEQLLVVYSGKDCEIVS